MLFADQLDTAGQTLSWAGIGGAFLTLLGTAFNGWLTYRSNRDRLSFDKRISDLERDVTEAKSAEQRALQSEERCRKELIEVKAELKYITDYLLKKGMPADSVLPK